MPLQLQVAAASHFGAAAAEVLDALLAQQPGARIGWPTGNTPLPLYAELRRRAASGPGRYAAMRAVMLDDYLDSPEAVGSHAWLRREVLDPLGVAEERLLRIPARAEGIEAACAAFEQRLRGEGGCDLLYLGLGANGHIGFNEPGAAEDSRTRAVELGAATAAANAAYWAGKYTPRRAVTMGIGTILEARRICLLVRGPGKATMLRKAVTGAVGPEVPASFLQHAARALVLADEAAAMELPMAWRRAAESVVSW